jgi:hypothetical protein
MGRRVRVGSPRRISPWSSRPMTGTANARAIRSPPMAFRRSVAALLTAAVVLAGCTGSTSQPQQSTITGATTPHTEYAPPPSLDTDARVPEPLVTNGRTVLQRVVVGSSVSVDGEVDGVAATFPPETRELVAGALVLADAPAGDATITWSAETNVGERTLFVAHATVQPRSVILSRAKSSGPLTEGIYRVRVTVGPESRDAVFVVSPLATKLATIAATDQSSLTSAGLRTQPPVTAGAGVDSTLTSDGTSDFPPAACFDDETLPDCQDWYNRPHSAPNAPPCTAETAPDLSITQDDTSLGGEVRIETSTVSCTRTEPISVAASVGAASPQPLATHGSDAEWMGSTCALPGKTDVFGDLVQAIASLPSSSAAASKAIRLGEFVPIPGVPKADPPLGTEVSDLQTISVTAFVMAFGATRGIKTLDVTAPDGSSVLHAGRQQPAAPCDMTLARFQAFGSGTYVVPQDGKTVVELTIRAETFDGSSVQYPLRWSKKPTWTGELTWDVTQPVPSGTQYQEMSADVVVSETGPYQLTGSITGAYGQKLDLSTCASTTSTMGTSIAQVTGTIDDSGMHLAVAPGQGSPPTLTPCPEGGPPASMGDPVTFPQLSQLLATLAPQGKSYSSHLDVTVPSGQYPFRVEAAVTLTPLVQDPIDTAAMTISAAQPPPP